MKSIYKIIAFGASLTLSSCFSTGPNLISVNPENIDNIPLKNTPLTSDQLKTWNQSDLLLDTICLLYTSPSPRDS